VLFDAEHFLRRQVLRLTRVSYCCKSRSSSSVVARLLSESVSPVLVSFRLHQAIVFSCSRDIALRKILVVPPFIDNLIWTSNYRTFKDYTLGCWGGHSAYFRRYWRWRTSIKLLLF